MSMLCHFVEQYAVMKVQDDLISSGADMVESLQNFLEQTLEQSCGVLSKQQSRKLNERLEELDNSEASLVDLLAVVFSSLVNKIGVLNSKIGLDIVENDYQVLETAVQKCEGEIRKHIRIEQQLKLYSDSLEEKLESFEKIIEAEKAKTAKINEQLGKATHENKDLEMKIKILEARLGDNDGVLTRPKKHTKYFSEVSFQQNGSSNNLKSGVHFSFDYKKRRKPMEKLNIRSKPISRQKSRVDCGQFQVAIDKREEKDLYVKKRHSANMNQLKEKMLGVKPYKDIFEMHKTLNVSEDSDKRRDNKKRYTEASSSGALRRQARCSSVCK